MFIIKYLNGFRIFLVGAANFLMFLLAVFIQEIFLKTSNRSIFLWHHFLLRLCSIHMILDPEKSSFNYILKWKSMQIRFFSI